MADMPEFDPDKIKELPKKTREYLKDFLGWFLYELENSNIGDINGIYPDHQHIRLECSYVDRYGDRETYSYHLPWDIILSGGSIGNCVKLQDAERKRLKQLEREQQIQADVRARAAEERREYLRLKKKFEEK